MKRSLKKTAQKNAASVPLRRKALNGAEQSAAQAALQWSQSEDDEGIDHGSTQKESALIDSHRDCARARVLWEKQRREAMRQSPGAMAFYEEALMRSAHSGALERIAKDNGLSDEQMREVWEKFLASHRERVVRLASGSGIDDGAANPSGIRREADETENEKNEESDENGKRPEELRRKDPDECARQDGMTDGEYGRYDEAHAIAERRRLINEEIGRSEYERCRRAKEAFADDKPRASKSVRPGGFLFRKGLLAAACAAVVCCLWVGVSALRGFDAGFLRTFGNFGFSQTIGVVDRAAARSFIAQLARSESLETVLAANEAFDALFLEAAAEVAGERRVILLESQAVVAAYDAETVDLTEAVRLRMHERLKTLRPSLESRNQGARTDLRSSP